MTLKATASTGAVRDTGDRRRYPRLDRVAVGLGTEEHPVRVRPVLQRTDVVGQVQITPGLPVVAADPVTRAVAEVVCRRRGALLPDSRQRRKRGGDGVAAPLGELVAEPGGP